MSCNNAAAIRLRNLAAATTAATSLTAEPVVIVHGAFRSAADGADPPGRDAQGEAARGIPLALRVERARITDIVDIDSGHSAQVARVQDTVRAIDALAVTR